MYHIGNLLLLLYFTEKEMPTHNRFHPLAVCYAIVYMAGLLWAELTWTIIRFCSVCCFFFVRVLFHSLCRSNSAISFLNGAIAVTSVQFNSIELNLHERHSFNFASGCFYMFLFNAVLFVRCLLFKLIYVQSLDFLLKWPAFVKTTWGFYLL